MTTSPASHLRKPLRLWPGIVAGVALALAWFIVPEAFPDVGFGAIVASLAAVVAIVVWWLFFSRAPWVERVGAILLAVVAILVTKRIVHPSIAGGMMGLMVPVYGVPVICLALVAGAAIGSRLTDGRRRVTIAVAILLVCGVFVVLRTGGMTLMHSELHWRWSPTPEERLLAQTAGEKDPRGSASRNSRRAAGSTCGSHEGSGESAGADSGKRSADDRRVARFSRTRARQQHSRRANRNRLDEVSTRRAVAAAGRTGLVVLRCPRQSHLHAGAAW